MGLVPLVFFSFIGLSILVAVLGGSVNIALRPLVQALSNRCVTTTQLESQHVLDQRLALLEDRLRRMEQSVTPLLDDDLLRRS
jgi:hypothetical protein